MEQQVKDLFCATMTGWVIEVCATLRPDRKYRIIATYEGSDYSGRQVFTCKIKRDKKGPYLFIDTF